MTDVERWIDCRVPAVPVALREWLAPATDHPVTVEHLTSLGVEALIAADPARRLDRPTAFALLAADAFLTYACEAAAEGGDVPAALVSVLDRVVSARRDE